jgi:hypothetical protein
MCFEELLYRNQINDLNTYGKLVCYADDTVLFVEGQTWDEVFTYRLEKYPNTVMRKKCIFYYFNKFNYLLL